MHIKLRSDQSCYVPHVHTPYPPLYELQLNQMHQFQHHFHCLTADEIDAAFFCLFFNGSLDLLKICSIHSISSTLDWDICISGVLTMIDNVSLTDGHALTLYAIHNPGVQYVDV